MSQRTFHEMLLKRTFENNTAHTVGFCDIDQAHYLPCQDIAGLGTDHEG